MLRCHQRQQLVAWHPSNRQSRARRPRSQGHLTEPLPQPRWQAEPGGAGQLWQVGASLICSSTGVALAHISNSCKFSNWFLAIQNTARLAATTCYLGASASNCQHRGGACTSSPTALPSSSGGCGADEAWISSGICHQELSHKCFNSHRAQTNCKRGPSDRVEGGSVGREGQGGRSRRPACACV